MRSAELLVKTLADDLAIANDHAADHRVRFDGALTMQGQRECVGHVPVIVVRAACQVRALGLEAGG